MLLSLLKYVGCASLNGVLYELNLLKALLNLTFVHAQLKERHIRSLPPFLVLNSDSRHFQTIGLDFQTGESTLAEVRRLDLGELVEKTFLGIDWHL